MKNHCLLYSICVCFIGASFVVNAAKIKVYRWVDQHGVVNFSQYRPSIKDYEEVFIEGKRLLTSLNKPITGVEIKENKEVAPEVVAELDAQATKYCQKAKHNLKVLESFKNVKLMDNNGQPVELKNDEVLEQKRLALRQIEMFCK